MELIMNMTVLYNTTPELNRYVGSFGGSSWLHLEGRISQAWRKWSYRDEKSGTKVLPSSVGYRRLRKMGHSFMTTFSHVFTSPEDRKSSISKGLVRMYPTTWHDIPEGSNFCAAKCSVYGVHCTANKPRFFIAQQINPGFYCIRNKPSFFFTAQQINPGFSLHSK
jgi:hypothetical protein